MVYIQSKYLLCCLFWKIIIIFSIHQPQALYSNPKSMIISNLFHLEYTDNIPKNASIIVWVVFMTHMNMMI